MEETNLDEGRVLTRAGREEPSVEPARDGDGAVFGGTDGAGPVPRPKPGTDRRNAAIEPPPPERAGDARGAVPWGGGRRQ